MWDTIKTISAFSFYLSLWECSITILSSLGKEYYGKRWLRNPAVPNLVYLLMSPITPILTPLS